MFFNIIVCILIICQMNIIWCKPWPQYGFNQSVNSAGNANWQNPYHPDANSYGLDSITTSTSRSLYPTLRPKHQPNVAPWNSNNNYYPQMPYDNEGQRSVNPGVYPLQPNLDNGNSNNNHQATIPPFKDNGFYNNPGAGHNNNIRPQITPTRPATVPFTRPAVNSYNRTLPTNRPTPNYNNNYHNNHNDRYNGGVYPNSQFDNSRNYNPQHPYQGGLNGNTNGNGTGNMYNYRPQPYDNRPGQPFNQNSNVQRPIDPYSGYNNIGQSTYNTPSNNNNRQLPNNGQSNYNIGQSSYNGPSNYDSFSNNNNNNNANNNNHMLSNRNSFEPSAPTNDLKNNGPPAQPDYDPNGIALAPFPGSDRLFNPQNIYGRQQPVKYNSPSGLYNTGTLHVPLAPFPAGP